MKKYLFYFLGILANVATMMAVEVNVEGVKYYVYPSSGTATASRAYVADAIIQDSVSYKDPKTWITTQYPVTAIADDAFNGNDSLKTIIIGNCVTNIYQKAFYNCENLKTVTIGNNVREIGKEAFAHCAKLEQINTPNSIELIAEDAFMECHKLPVTNNIRYADKFLVEASNKRNSAYYIANNTTIQPNTRWIGKEAFSGALFRNTTLVIPDSVELIGESAFYGGDYESVIIGKKVKQIGKQAFVGRIAGETTYLKTFRLKATTPPQIATKTVSGVAGTSQDIFEFPAIPDIYVPCVTLEAYLQSKWGEIKSYGEQKVMYRPYNLEYDYNSDEGYVNVIGNQTPNECEPQLEIEAIALEGYEFDKWWDGNEENPRTIQFDDSLDGITIKPIFKSKGEGLEDIYINGITPQKVLIEGQIFIRRGEKVYTVHGEEVR